MRAEFPSLFLWFIIFINRLWVADWWSKCGVSRRRSNHCSVSIESMRRGTRSQFRASDEPISASAWIWRVYWFYYGEPTNSLSSNNHSRVPFFLFIYFVLNFSVAYCFQDGLRGVSTTRFRRSKSGLSNFFARRRLVGHVSQLFPVRGSNTAWIFLLEIIITLIKSTYKCYVTLYAWT